MDCRTPARTGDVLQINCTGLGPVTNQLRSGTAAADPRSTATTATLNIGGIPAEVSFAGLARFVGLFQVEPKVPTGVAASSAVPVVLSIGGVTSQAVVIAVH